MKVHVRIHTPSELKVQKCKVSYDGKRVLIRNETKKKPGWNPEIGTLEVKRNWFGRSVFFVDTFPEATKTWTIDTKQLEADMPKWDKFQSKKYIEAKLVEKTGQEPKEKMGGTIFYIIALLAIINIAITLWASGRIKIG
jgi:hypothetical protein